jgi:hypothetical protein
MLVPLTQLLRVKKIYFPLALPGPKGINVEFRAQRSEVRSQRSEERIADCGFRIANFKKSRGQKTEDRGQGTNNYL